MHKDYAGNFTQRQLFSCTPRAKRPLASRGTSFHRREPHSASLPINTAQPCVMNRVYNSVTRAGAWATMINRNQPSVSDAFDSPNSSHCQSKSLLTSSTTVRFTSSCLIVITRLLGLASVHDRLSVELLDTNYVLHSCYGRPPGHIRHRQSVMSTPTPPPLGA